MTTPNRTIIYGDVPVPVLERDWLRTREMLPYRKTYLLKPDQRWHDAPSDSASTLSEHYVQLAGGAVPAGAVIARELATDGAAIAVWTECYGRGRVVLMSPELVCIEATGELAQLLQ